MTQEEKAKAYDEVLNKLRYFMAQGVDPLITRADVQDFFPELLESEDEKMRAMAIKAVYAPDAQSCIKSWGINPDDVIAWLEKQGEQKHTPKHKIGDTIYYNSFGEVKSMVVSDVAIDGTDNPMYEGKDGNAVFEKDLIEQKPARCAWTERDEKQARQIERIVSNDGCTKQLQEQIHNWFKSLKGRVQPLPKHEWSKEDRETIDYLIDYLESELDSSYTKEDKEEFTKDIELLKSLRPHSQWKPSEEQMTALRRMKAAIAGEGEIYKPLNSLYEDLKKLREE